MWYFLKIILNIWIKPVILLSDKLSFYSFGLKVLEWLRLIVIIWKYLIPKENCKIRSRPNITCMLVVRCFNDPQVLLSPLEFLKFRYFLIISPWKKAWSFNWKKLESPSLKDALCQVWLKLAQWFWRKFLNLVNVFSLFL